MPRRSILSAAERDSLLALPDTQDELIRLYTFSEPDLSLIRQRRGDANRLGVAVQLCWHCCKVSDEAAFCLIQRPYISKTLLTRRISPRGSP